MHLLIKNHIFYYYCSGFTFVALAWAIGQEEETEIVV